MISPVQADFDHPLRRQLNDEVHARPPDSIPTPSTISYLARLIPRGADPEDELKLLSRLVDRMGGQLPVAGSKHFVADFEQFRLRWERHTEFVRYAFIHSSPEKGPFDSLPIARVPQNWLRTLDDKVLVAAHAVLADAADVPLEFDQISRRHFEGNTLVGSRIAGDTGAVAVTDFRIQSDGFNRILILNESMSEAQSGRVVQRLLDLESYRMLTLLALPVAQGAMSPLEKSEQELVAIGESLASGERDQEQPLLERLTMLAAENQDRQMRSDFRFAAAGAYHELVQQRINELRETRIPGLQTFDEFTTRRLSPAVNTCRAVAKRQDSIVRRTGRATLLLSTRVDIARQVQSQELLASVNRRLKVQMRLQATVEGLSIAAVTYYVVGLLETVLDSMEFIGSAGLRAPILAISVPLVALLLYSGVRRMRKRIRQEEPGL